MSKFKVNVKLQGYEVKLGSIEFSVEGEKEDAQKISQEIERQLGGMIHGPAVIAPTSLKSGNGNSNQRVLEGQVSDDENGTDKATKGRSRKSGGSSGSRTPSEHSKVGQRCKRQSGSCTSSTNKPASPK
jgi:hypothetical protein